MAANDFANACWAGNINDVRRRLDAGEDVNGPPGEANPLIFAAFQGQLEIVRLLVEHGADLTRRETSGKSAEDHAREKGFTSIVELLSAEALRRAGPQESWLKMGASTVAFVGTYPYLRRKLTHIFNFETRERLIVTENLQTKAETTPPVTSFDDLPSSAVEKALDAFARLGGETDRSFALHGTERLAKPRPGLDLK